MIIEQQCEVTYLLTYVPSEDSNQPAHPCGLIRAFNVCMKKLCILGYQVWRNFVSLDTKAVPSEDSEQTVRIATDKRGYPYNIFLISWRKHMLWVLIRSALPRHLMSTHNICFHWEIRKISAAFGWKKCLTCCYVYEWADWSESLLGAHVQSYIFWPYGSIQGEILDDTCISPCSHYYLNIMSFWQKLLLWL